ncbi:hypothetical protein UA08_09019 [Talaromyces atroroseus]|uniref:V-type ATPase assembly factor PKR1 n=1 Tax=Talaromyces atroroseus TaxID=1441469 RepID=A0A1Q5Q755_TALAT|nr:hypothetical protein UA08_09019 [Talaromyces atroroseus]OKL55677.1 hypothetical protein UA08_09019 [Talaromyces atroroseus]
MYSTYVAWAVFKLAWMPKASFRVLNAPSAGAGASFRCIRTELDNPSFSHCLPPPNQIPEASFLAREYTDMSISFVEDLWSSVFTPGPTQSLLVATNATFAALQLVLFLLLVATYSVHFVILSILSGALWWAINWFAMEVRAVQARQEEEKRQQDAIAEKDKSRSSSRINTSADANDSDTETEVGGVSRTRRRRPDAANPTSAVESNKSSDDDQHSQKKGVQGESSGYTSTDSEWEKVDKDKSA